jgi:2-isopropylmalate synthase
MKKITILDTTLRDGEQSAHFTLEDDDKIKFAKMLEELGVDIIEVGFPSSSMKELNIIKKISREISESTICVMSRLNKDDVLACKNAVEGSPKNQITLIIPTNAHTEMSLIETENLMKETFTFAKQYFRIIQFAIQDATRIDRSILYYLATIAAGLGAKSLTIADTVGISTPFEYGKLFKDLQIILKGKNIALVAHCHNDLGQAVANTLAAIQNGANQVECTILGVGERAGNAALEEIIGILLVRKDLGFETSINASKILNTCKFFTKISGFHASKNKPIVGENLFSHKSGIHQKEIIRNPLSFEPYNINIFGNRKRKFLLGKHSGSHAIKFLLDNNYISKESTLSYSDFVSLIKNGNIEFDGDFEID